MRKPGWEAVGIEENCQVHVLLKRICYQGCVGLRSLGNSVLKSRLKDSNLDFEQKFANFSRQTKQNTHLSQMWPWAAVLQPLVYRVTMLLLNLRTLGHKSLGHITQP